MFERKNIKTEILEFVESSQFENFKKIMEDFATAKFAELQKAPENETHADLIAGRKVLNFYINLPKEIEFRKRQIEQEKQIEAERTE